MADEYEGDDLLPSDSEASENPIVPKNVAVLEPDLESEASSIEASPLRKDGGKEQHHHVIDDDDIESVDLPDSDGEDERALPQPSPPRGKAVVVLAEENVPNDVVQSPATSASASPPAPQRIVAPPSPPMATSETKDDPRASRPVNRTSAARAVSASPSRQPKKSSTSKPALRAASANPVSRHRAGYLHSTEAERRRAESRSKPCHLREPPPSPPFLNARGGHSGGAVPRKAPKSGDPGPKRPPALQYCLGKKVADLLDQPSAAFISHTPRNVFPVPDVPAPGYTIKVDTPASISAAFPDRGTEGRAKGVTGFGSTTPRDLTYSLTNGSVREISAKKTRQTYATPHKVAQPAGAPTWETIPMYSSFSPTPYRQAEKGECTSSWALSKVGRDPYEMHLVEKEMKQRERRKKGPELGHQQPPKKSDKDWLQFARMQVRRPAEPRDLNKPAFGSTGKRACLSFGKATTAPAPGDYNVP